jgi:nitrate/TMAO reductase-like tetraheme cytochrome c subunit
MNMAQFIAFLRSWVYFANNWLSLTGVGLVTTATVTWLFLLPITLRGEVTHPYVGILVFLLVPAMFIAGLLLIPAGILLRRRRDHRKSIYPTNFPPLTWQNSDFRKLVLFIGITTCVNIAIASQATYAATEYMDSTTFCGLTCHKVMQPEYTAHEDSPHARVDCVACHIGPGVSWFVRSKFSGTGQVFATVLETYPRPIPSPVKNLRPARETCEVCHWPARFDAERLRVIPQYADDEKNTLTQTVLMMKIGGGNRGGIHGVHVGQGVYIRYAYADDKRQTIPWVEYTDRSGRTTAYLGTGSNAAAVEKMPVREMDCIDCHNRPAHAFQLPGRAIDDAIAARQISPALPFVKKQGLALLKANYGTREEAERKIPAELTAYYQKNYPAVYPWGADSVRQAGVALVALYDRNVFPGMKVTWGTYADNVGHTDFPGCFRCHDGSHTSSDGKTVTQDCSACHNMLAMQETNPKILTDLGLTAAGN